VLWLLIQVSQFSVFTPRRRNPIAAFNVTARHLLYLTAYYQPAAYKPGVLQHPMQIHSFSDICDL